MQFIDVILGILNFVIVLLTLPDRDHPDSAREGRRAGRVRRSRRIGAFGTKTGDIFTDHRGVAIA